MDQPAPDQHDAADPTTATATPTPEPLAPRSAVEHGGRRSNVSNGLEPTRFGDWEKDGRCIDF